MKTNLPYLILLLLGPSVGLIGQNYEKPGHEINYVDSAIYYFQRCLQTNPIEDANFLKAEEMVSQMKVNQLSINRIEKISRDFRNQNKKDLSDRIMAALLYSVSRTDNVELAIHYFKNIIDNYDGTNAPDYKFTALTALLELRIPLRKKSIPETFDYYASRLKVYLDKKDSSALAITYFCLGATYRLTGLTDMTIYNLKKSLSYINKNDTKTFLQINGLNGWMNNTSVLGQLYIETGDYKSAIAYSKAARDIRINILQEKNVSFLNCNIAYAKLMLNELDSVNYLLDSAIQLATEVKDYPSLARSWEIKGQYFLALNQLDSAETSLHNAKKIMILHNVDYFNPAGSLTPDYYLAKVRMLQNRFHDARRLLEQEVKDVRSIKKEVLKEQKLLIEVYHKLGDSKSADATFREFTELQAEINAEDRKNRTKSFEIEAKIEEAENTIDTLTTDKKIADLTKKYLIGIAILLLVIVAIIFNRFRVTRRQKTIIEKEKQRSEKLLLNILPSEVAEELKAKGKVDAKQFTDVTVMFTDFKGFTQISEKLSPVELVAEIDKCFKAFDHIITKHNVEKIKTIGDAYMCAEGLPVANSTHAEDIVKAAIEIQQYMHQHFQQQKEEDKEIFEIRIGIHTGPVIAGIVGIKKFAYDIWGDTVNIAARMESSGEPGKINISGSTFELVKDKFPCSYRGKIQAKNKGEIDMYFVEKT